MVVVAALIVACGGSTERPPAAPTVATPDLPSPESYAAQLDSEERYWWQRPERVVALVRCEAGMTVVDLGAGTGYFVPYLSRAVGRSGRVLALDIDPAMIDSLSRRVVRDRLHNVTAVRVSADDPALTPRSVDRVLVVNTWHHVGNRTDYAEALASALRTGGELLIVDFTEDSPKGPPKAHRLTPAQVLSELQAAGFEAEVLEAGLPYQYVVRGRVP
ncbi:MAG: class I SAM-dependent methyltransferase [Myxococcota bacterium]